MTSIYGRKYVVISQEEYQQLKDNSTNDESISLLQPEKADLRKSEAEMRNVWSRELPPDEKIRLFTEELNNFKTRHNSLIKPKPLEVVMKRESSQHPETKLKEGNDTRVKSEDLQQEEDDKRIIGESAIHTIPKASKKHAIMLIDHIRSRSNILDWNASGEMIFRGDVIQGSNISDLISHVMTNRKTLQIPILYKTIFSKALSELNIPNDWIKNKEQIKVLQTYKHERGGTRTLSSESLANKKQKINWLSST